MTRSTSSSIRAALVWTMDVRRRSTGAPRHVDPVAFRGGRYSKRVALRASRRLLSHYCLGRVRWGH